MYNGRGERSLQEEDREKKIGDTNRYARSGTNGVSLVCTDLNPSGGIGDTRKLAKEQ